MKPKNSYIISLLILLGIFVWMYNVEIVVGGQPDSNERVPSIADRLKKNSKKIFKVRYVPISAGKYYKQISVRGRTKARSVVPVRAETSGVLKQRVVDKGNAVKQGDLVCLIERGVRKTRVNQAKAQLAQAQINHVAKSKLIIKKFASQSQLKATKFALDSAKTSLAAAKWELSRTQIKAPISGIVQDPVAEIGSRLSIGSSCVTLISLDPMLFVGQLSENEVGNVEVGMEASVRMVTDKISHGSVRYIAPSADTKTRSFLLEIMIPNPQQEIRDGLTATAIITLPPEEAYRISPSWLTLSNLGNLGLKILNKDNAVQFIPVTILAQTSEGFWITGLKPKSRVITLGQEYVGIGERVKPVLDMAEMGKIIKTGIKP